MAKKSHGWGKIITNLLLVIPSIFNIVSHFIFCLECELAQAKRSLILLFILAIVAITLMISAWLCLCAIIFLWLQTFLSTIVSLTVLLGGHLVLLLIVGMWMAIVKNGLLFKNTRELFRN